MSSNLPGQGSVKSFFDNQFQNQVTFPAADIDATTGFFVKRGFDTNAANSTAIILLNQARADNVPVFSLLDKLKGLTDVQLSQVVVQVLNASRESTSLLGYRIATVSNTFEARNILV